MTFFGRSLSLARPEMSALPSLSIVIPAYNEEGAIASIIERTLAARDTICRQAALASVEVIVVSDGSTDATTAIASRYADITLVSYEDNRGYGAAIKEGFSRAGGELLSFLDADGTCDPLFFGSLCRVLLSSNADIALGARLGKQSQMPRLRRLGNRAYATLLSAWGAHDVTDSASGMRVVRRTALRHLYPLPDGMHFTPAMSSIALFDSRLTIVEVPMQYAERTGESKLSVARDGIRFLRTIADTALSYRPLRFFGAAGISLLVLAFAYGVEPLLYYVRAQRIEQWMFYRLSAVAVAISCGVTLLAVGVLAQQAVEIIHDDFRLRGGWRALVDRVLLHNLIPIGFALVTAAFLLSWRSISSYVVTGTVTSHWIYTLTSGLLVTLGLQCLSFGMLARTLHILATRRRDGLSSQL